MARNVLMSDEKITRTADCLGRNFRCMLKLLAEGHFAEKQVQWFQADQLKRRFKNPLQSLRTLKALGLVQSWDGRRRYREPDGELWAINMDGIGVHYELVNRGLYESRSTISESQ